MNTVQEKAYRCNLCFDTGEIWDRENPQLDERGFIITKECPHVTKDQIRAHAGFLDQINMAGLDLELACINAGLWDSHPKHYTARRFPNKLIQGSSEKIFSSLARTHWEFQWKTSEAVIYRTDKEIADERNLSFETDDGEVSYADAQKLLASSNLLILTLGISRSKSIVDAVSEILGSRIHKNKDTWLVAPDSANIEPYEAITTNFHKIMLGTAPTPVKKGKTNKTSKFNGICSVCNTVYQKGDPIEWKAGKPVHPSCL